MFDESRQTQSLERVLPMPRSKNKQPIQMVATSGIGRVQPMPPMPPPRRTNSQQRFVVFDTIGVGIWITLVFKTLFV